MNVQKRASISQQTLTFSRTWRITTLGTCRNGSNAIVEDLGYSWNSANCIPFPALVSTTTSYETPYLTAIEINMQQNIHMLSYDVTTNAPIDALLSD